MFSEKQYNANLRKDFDEYLKKVKRNLDEIIFTIPSTLRNKTLEELVKKNH